MRFALLLILGTLPQILASDDEFTPLITSDDLSAFHLVGIDQGSVTVVAQEIRVSGVPSGYLVTKESYKNYILKLEWKYDRPEGYKPGDKFQGNSGVLLHVAGKAKVWPKAIEVQLAHSDPGAIIGIQGGSFSSTVNNATRAKAQKAAVKPVGEWNHHEITCKNGEIRSTINDILIDCGTSADPSAGPIGLQSEGVPIRFRFVRIKKLD